MILEFSRYRLFRRFFKSLRVEAVVGDLFSGFQALSPDPAREFKRVLIAIIRHDISGREIDDQVIQGQPDRAPPVGNCRRTWRPGTFHRARNWIAVMASPGS